MGLNTLYVLLVHYVDEKKIRKDIFLGFIIKPCFSSAFDLLGQSKAITS